MFFDSPSTPTEHGRLLMIIFLLHEETLSLVLRENIAYESRNASSIAIAQIRPEEKEREIIVSPALLRGWQRGRATESVNLFNALCISFLFKCPRATKGRERARSNGGE